jgi:cytochrome c-type biogenesis protein CcmE
MNVKRVKFLIAGAVLLSAFLFLFLTSFNSENLAYFLTVDEIADKIADKNSGLKGRGIRVEGKIVPKSLVRNPEAMKIAFRMQGEKATLPVNFKGVAPDLLDAGFPVIAEGKLDANGVLVANNLMVACPSKFEEMKSAGEKVPEAAEHKKLIEGVVRITPQARN